MKSTLQKMIPQITTHKDNTAKNICTFTFTGKLYRFFEILSKQSNQKNVSISLGKMKSWSLNHFKCMVGVIYSYINAVLTDLTINLNPYPLC